MDIPFMVMLSGALPTLVAGLAALVIKVLERHHYSIKQKERADAQLARADDMMQAMHEQQMLMIQPPEPVVTKPEPDIDTWPEIMDIRDIIADAEAKAEEDWKKEYGG